jgi:uncharacterized RDD family membrane protein YckC
MRSGSALREIALAPATPDRRAGLVSRGGAFVVDLVLLALVLRGIVWVALLVRHALPRFVHQPPVGAVLAATAPIVFGLYHVICWRLIGWTFGKWLFGLEVVNLDGGRLRPMQPIGRVLGYVVSALPFYLGFLWVLMPGRRAWHDILAHTAVVYRRTGAR